MYFTFGSPPFFMGLSQIPDNSAPNADKNKKEQTLGLLLKIKFVYLCDKNFRGIICSKTKDFWTDNAAREYLKLRH